LTVIDVIAGWVTLQASIVSIVLSLILGICLVYLGFFGGADAKALLFIALTVPAYPTEFNPLLGDLISIPVLTVFFNSTLLSLICPLTVSALNTADILRGKKLFRGVEVDIFGKFVLFLTARRVDLGKLEEGLFYFPAETVVEEDGKLVRRPLHFVKAEDDTSSLIAALKRNRNLYSDGVLASPTIPFIVFFTFGLALLPLGNLVFWVVQRIF